MEFKEFVKCVLQDQSVKVDGEITLSEYLKRLNETPKQKQKRIMQDLKQAKKLLRKFRRK